MTPVANPETWIDLLSGLPQISAQFPIIDAIIALLAIVALTVFLYTRMKRVAK